MKKFTKFIAIMLTAVMVLSTVNPTVVHAEDWIAISGTNDEDIENNYGQIDTNNGTVYTNHTDGAIITNNGFISANHGLVKFNRGKDITINISGTYHVNKGIFYNSFLIVTNYGYVFENCADAVPVDTSVAYDTWIGGVRENEAGGVIHMNYGAVGLNKGTIDNNAGYVSNNSGGTIGINRQDKTAINGGGGTITDNFGNVTFKGANAFITNQYDGTVIGDGLNSTITNYFGGVVSGSGITVTNNFTDITDDTPTAVRNALNQYRAVTLVAPEHSEVTYGNGFTEKMLTDQHGYGVNTLQYIKQGTDATITIIPADGWVAQYGSSENDSGRIETEDYAFNYGLEYLSNHSTVITISGYSGNSCNISLADFNLVEREFIEDPEDIRFFRWEKNNDGDYEAILWTSDDDFGIELADGEEYDLYLSYGAKDAYISIDGGYRRANGTGHPENVASSRWDHVAPSPIASLSEDQAGTSDFTHYIFTSEHVADGEWSVWYTVDDAEAYRAFTVKAKTTPATDPQTPSGGGSSSGGGGSSYGSNNTTTTKNADGSTTTTTTTETPDDGVKIEKVTTRADGSKTVDVMIKDRNGNYTQEIVTTYANGTQDTTEITFWKKSDCTSKRTEIEYADGRTVSKTDDEYDNGDYDHEETVRQGKTIIEQHIHYQLTKKSGTVKKRDYDKTFDGKDSFTQKDYTDGSSDASHVVVNYADNTREETVTTKAVDGKETTTYTREAYKSGKDTAAPAQEMTVETDEKGKSTLTELKIDKAWSVDMMNETVPDPNMEDKGQTELDKDAGKIPEDDANYDWTNKDEDRYKDLGRAPEENYDWTANDEKSYRVYNANNGDHVYTTSDEELQDLVGADVSWLDAGASLDVVRDGAEKFDIISGGQALNLLILPSSITTADGKEQEISTIGTGALAEIAASGDVNCIVADANIATVEANALGNDSKVEALVCDGAVTFEKNALKGAKKLKVIALNKTPTLKKNSLKGTSKDLTIRVSSKKDLKALKKKLKKAGNVNAKVEIMRETTKNK